MSQEKSDIVRKNPSVTWKGSLRRQNAVLWWLNGVDWITFACFICIWTIYKHYRYCIVQYFTSKRPFFFLIISWLYSWNTPTLFLEISDHCFLWQLPEYLSNRWSCKVSKDAHGGLFFCYISYITCFFWFSFKSSQFWKQAVGENVFISKFTPVLWKWAKKIYHQHVQKNKAAWFSCVPLIIFK